MNGSKTSSSLCKCGASPTNPSGLHSWVARTTRLSGLRSSKRYHRPPPATSCRPLRGLDSSSHPATTGSRPWLHPAARCAGLHRLHIQDHGLTPVATSCRPLCGLAPLAYPRPRAHRPGAAFSSQLSALSLSLELRFLSCLRVLRDLRGQKAPPPRSLR